ncbi:MAG: alpha/beta hydrolase [Candidatus Heimdallarchaeota archaeon]|nr:alpha/beta hydrolase [Candidatus Heimdallarchaeota archaeon]MDH5647793.1 alpha/beta hydrolase [Candidatus Heimdallarchaeota archaeon]
MDRTLLYIYGGENKEGPIIIVGHGATTPRISNNNILVKSLLPLVREIWSIELPGHHKEIENITTMNAEEVINDIQNVINQKITETENISTLGFIGFSLSGILCMRLENPPWDWNVYIGCGPRIDHSYLKNIQKYFTEETYIKYGFHIGMANAFGKSWKERLKLVRKWFNDDSIIVTTSVDGFSIPTLFILAEQDQAFPTVYDKIDGLRIEKVKGHHFSYFTGEIFPSVWKRIVAFL